MDVQQCRRGAVHKVRHAIFGQFLPPFPSVTLCHTSRNSLPKKIRHTSRTPPILVGLIQKTRKKFPVQILSIVRPEGHCPGVLVWKALSGVAFVRSPFCLNTSVTIES